MSSQIDTQFVSIQRLVAPEGINLGVTGPSLDPTVAGSLGWDPANPNNLYVATGSVWNAIGGSGDTVVLGVFGSSPNTAGASITGSPIQTLVLQPADATRPGGVSTSAQSFAGVKTLVNGEILNNMAPAMYAAYNTPTFFEQDESFQGTLPILSLSAGGASATQDWQLQKIGRMVMLNIFNSVTVTIAVNGNTISSTVGAVPANYRPTVDTLAKCTVYSNSVYSVGWMKITSAGTLTFYTGFGATGFSNSGSSGVAQGVIIYSI